MTLQNIDAISAELADSMSSYEDFSDSILQLAKSLEFDNRQIILLNRKLLHIKQYISDLQNPDSAVKREFEFIVQSEFTQSLNSFGASESHIHFYDDTTDAEGSHIDVVLQKGKISNLSIGGSLSLEDITYIESPVYMHILDMLRQQNSPSHYRGIYKTNIPHHLSDMADKMLDTSLLLDGLFADFNEYASEANEISDIISGDFVVDENTRQLQFKRFGISIPVVSVASGIKSFGMLLRLLKSGNVSSSKMLVLDEPEIHLHPEWQLQFCQLIIELVAKGVPIVVSTHSPYFIQALRYYAAAKSIEQEVTYYMAETCSDTTLSNFQDVTHDLNKVFTLLAAPLQKIMNIDTIRK